MMKSNHPAAHAVLDLHPPRADFRADFINGLRRQPKRLPCKYFYDAHGSELFERICELPEYYPTRTELRILADHGPEFARLAGPGANIVELGSGSARKIRALLDHLQNPGSYVPVDISRSALLGSAAEMQRHFPDLNVRPVCADYTRRLVLPEACKRGPGRTVLFFPGSTIGNFSREEAAAFLARLSRDATPDALLLIGVDLKKDREILEAAYNDSRGVTARFNFNLLARANRELGARFNPDDFRHRAVWNAACGRIEMHLISSLDHAVAINGTHITFKRDEVIVTEESYKYEIPEFQALARSAGYLPVRAWTDRERLFSVHLLAPGT